MNQIKSKYILVTGATGKVGQAFIQEILSVDKNVKIRALCHNREVEVHNRLDMVKGSISNRDVCKTAMKDITHVVHLATCKETPEDVMDVTVKGLFWLLEEARNHSCFKRFVLIGGDASIGHFFYEQKYPVTENKKHQAYPGCYALSKVLEEVMLQQFATQYNLDTCCLRAPWIMEKDDFKYTMKIGEEQFGGQLWTDLLNEDEVNECVNKKYVPILCDKIGVPIKRNFVHVKDLVAAIIIALDHPNAKQELFNICMDEPVDYAKVGELLKSKYNIDTYKAKSDTYSTWLDNSKAKFILDWKPKYDLDKLIEESWNYERKPEDSRKIWYLS